MEEIQVGIDVGWDSHEVQILHPDGRYERMRLAQGFDSFNRLVRRLEELKDEKEYGLVIGIEGSNGHASPLDEYLLHKGYKVYNVSSTHLERLRTLYGAEFKDDKYDAKLICIHLKNRESMVLEEKTPVVEVLPKKEAEEKLKVLSRVIGNVIRETTRMKSQLISCLKSFFPEMVQLSNCLDRKWLLLVLREYPCPSRLREQTVESLREIRDPKTGMRIRRAHAAKLIELAKKVDYRGVAEEEKGLYVAYLAEELLRRIEKLKELEKRVGEVGKGSAAYQAVGRLAGAGSKVTSRLVGEIGNIARFRSESSMAAYLGVCKLTKDSGKTSRNKKNLKVNRRGKNAILELAYQSSRFSEESRRYYERKRREGKTHLHALRCLGRHLSRDIYQTLSEQNAVKLRLSGRAA